jgi:hypothetical protein
VPDLLYACEQGGCDEGTVQLELIEMVLSKVVVQLQRMKQLSAESAQDHKRLIRLLDSLQLDTLQVSLGRRHPQKWL